MDKPQKERVYRLFVTTTLAACDIVLAVQKTQNNDDVPPMPEIERHRKILRQCQIELAKPQCSVLKVENLFIELIEPNTQP